MKSFETLLTAKGDVFSVEDVLVTWVEYLTQSGIPQPEGNLVLVKPIKIQREGTLLLPDDYGDNKKFGLVISAGENVRPTIHSGAKVMWLKDAGERCTFDGEEYIFMVDNQIKATIK